MLMKIIFVLFSVFYLIDASAIPMWEFLSRDEKMSYLYNTFQNQVDSYCEFSNMQNCNKELIKYGLSKLSNMPDDHLDRMDPYQRGAHTIIWDSMMEGHEVMQQKPTSRPETTTQQANRRKDTTQRIESIQDKIGSLGSGDDKYLEDPFNNYLNTAASSKFELSIPDMTNEFPTNPVGPMVIRVRPDGTPVDKRMPADEDLVHFKMSKTKIPSVSSLDKLVASLRPSNVYGYESRPFAVYVAPRRR